MIIQGKKEKKRGKELSESRENLKSSISWEKKVVKKGIFGR